MTVTETARSNRSPESPARDDSVLAQQISLWMTPVVLAGILVAFVSFPGFLPPMSPTMSAAEVAAFYEEHRSAVRFSMIVFNLLAIALVPFFMVIVVQMKRMATPSQVFAYCYLAAVANGATLFALADLFWLIAAFRPERDPELLLLLNDLAWMLFAAPVGMLVVQCITLALAIYLDRQPRPVLPRWAGHFNVVTAALVLPAACAAVVTDGPLAWDGLVSFWVKNSALALYVVVMLVLLLQAVRRQAEESAPVVVA